MSARRVPVVVSWPIPEAPALARLWRDRPAQPRGVAALLFGMEVEDDVASARRAGEPALAAALLADAYQVREEFAAVYGLPWAAAYPVFQAAMLFSVRTSERLVGEVVWTLPASRLCEHLGMVDGLAGAIDGPDAPAAYRPAALTHAPLSAAERRAARGARGRAQRVFGRAYARGLQAGLAERMLRLEAPTLLDLADHVLHGAMAAVPTVDTCRAAWREVRALARRGVRRLHGDHHATAFLLYGRHQLRLAQRRAATAALADLSGESIPLPAVTTGAALRVLSRAHAAAVAAGERSRQQELGAQLAAATLAAAGAGFSATLYAACRELPYPTLAPATSVLDLVAASARDLEWGRQVRALLRGLVGDRPATSRGTPARIAEHIRARVDDAWRTLDAASALRTVAGYPVLVPGAAAAWVAVSRELEGVELDALGTWEGFTAYEAVAAGAPARDPQVEVEASALLHDVFAPVAAAAEARRLLAWADPAASRRAMAEAELVAHGDDADVEAAEGWVRGYRAEAAGCGAVPDRLRRLAADGATDGLVLLAQARLVEAALERRAQEAARALLATYLPRMGVAVYTAADPGAAIQHGLLEALRRAAQALPHETRGCPRFGDRVRWWAPRLAFDWYLIELEAAATVAASPPAHARPPRAVDLV